MHSSNKQLHQKDFLTKCFYYVVSQSWVTEAIYFSALKEPQILDSIHLASVLSNQELFLELIS